MSYFISRRCYHSIRSCAIEVGGHSFDMRIEIEDEIYVSLILLAVDFAEHSVTRGRDDEFCL
jgi:hypothetical protein